MQTYLESLAEIDLEIQQALSRIEYQQIHRDAAFYNVLVLRMDRFDNRTQYQQELRERANTYREYRDLLHEAEEMLKQLKIRKSRLYVY